MLDPGEELRGRLKELEDTGYPAYNEACYDLVGEFVVLPLMQEMNARFRTRHFISAIGGAGQTGSLTSAITVMRPRPILPGRWNAIKRFFSPDEKVISIHLARGWECWFKEEYREFAEKMDQVYQEHLARHLL